MTAGVGSCNRRFWPEKRPVKSKKKLYYDKCRMSIDPPKADRIKEFFLFYLLNKQSEATTTIRQSSFIIRHSLKFHMSKLLKETSK
jgi:hypothetical protein